MGLWKKQHFIDLHNGRYQKLRIQTTEIENE